MRIGFGYDSHVFEDGKPLVLGGIKIPDCPGLKAHSDGDALVHALIDALFGAVALGNIGSHFPDTDPKWKGADSMRLLETAVSKVRSAGYEFGNADITVVCEKPRLSNFVFDMCRVLASVIGCEIGDISIKGKTNEKMDDVGASKGIAVYAAVLVRKVR